MDALLELLLVLAEIFLEVIFEFAGEVLDAALRALGEIFENVSLENPVIASIGYAALGWLAG
jgi:hypothetical protein